MNLLDRRFHLVADHDIDVDYVDALGENLSQRKLLATCFQIWQRRVDKRPLYKVQDRDLIQKVGPEDADVALTIFGYGCGTVHTEFERKANTTRMFLKLNHPRALEALQSVDFSRFYKNTAYTEALSLAEINFLVNEFVFGESGLLEST